MIESNYMEIGSSHHFTEDFAWLVREKESIA